MNTSWACKNMSAHAGPNLHIQEQTHNLFSTKTQPKHVPTPPKVSGFHLNLSHSKTQAFTSLKTYQNGRSKEKLNNKKSLKNLLIRSLHSPKGVVVICRSRKEPSSALLLHSNKWDGRHRWKGCRNSSWTWVPLKEMRKFEREVEIKKEDEGQIGREWERGKRLLWRELERIWKGERNEENEKRNVW